MTATVVDIRTRMVTPPPPPVRDDPQPWWWPMWLFRRPLGWWLSGSPDSRRSLRAQNALLRQERDTAWEIVSAFGGCLA
jgi:hypothetical protein